MRHLITDFKNGLIKTKCERTNVSFFDGTIWWRDVDCPDCMARMPAPRPKRRKIVKVAD